MFVQNNVCNVCDEGNFIVCMYAKNVMYVMYVSCIAM